MSNPFREMKSKQKQSEFNDEPVEEIEGLLNCQTCGETVTSGLLYPNLKLVTWLCSNNHLSKLDNYIE